MVLKLNVSLNGRTIRKYEIEDERFLIGRSSDCEVSIDNLGVSRYHSEVILKNDVYVLRDLQSNNGTYVNGRRVMSCILNDGDEISISKFSLSIIGLTTPVLQDLSKKDTLDEGNDTVAGAGEIDYGATLAMGEKAMAKVQKGRRVRGYLSMESKGKTHNFLLDKSLFFFGNDKDADIRVSGFFTPRRMALINRDDSGFRLVNLANNGKGVSVNGKPVVDVRLANNDVIRLKGFTLRFKRGTPSG